MSRRAQLLLAGAALPLLALGAAACGGGSSTTTSQPAATRSTTGGSTAGGSTAEIVIHNYSFHPATDTVKPGETITVKNEDSTTHTLTATGASQGAFNTGDIVGGASKTFTAPTKPGTYHYLCLIHTFMTGTLVVS